MPFLAPISACLVLLLTLAWLERIWRHRAWRTVSIRIHVNGTRGKSTVTRLIWAGLRAGGIAVLGKTTGAAPCLLLPDGTEQSPQRRGKPNIREQLRTLLLARKLQVRAVVLECMAIAPDLQWVAEHDMVRASIGVITNARTDHTEAMGRTRPEIAASLANTIPRNGMLVVGESALATAYRNCAAERGTQVVVADSTVLEKVDPSVASRQPWERENIAIALAVTRQLGIADDVALPAMCELGSHFGDAAPGTLTCGAAMVPYLDARKVNDPESFLQVLTAFLAGAHGPGNVQPAPLLVFNHRSDRPHRLLSFAALAFAQSGAPEIVITGQKPAWTSWRKLRRTAGLPPVRFVTLHCLREYLVQNVQRWPGVVFCGNIQGCNVSELQLMPKVKA
jgi:gamma-polyglutamate synthase